MATLNPPPRDASEHRPPLRAVDEPPHDPLAEQAILGAILRTAQDDNTAAAELLTQAPDPSDYYRPAHETLAAHLTDAAAAGEPLDPIAIHARLHQSGELKPGHLDAAYLYDLVAVAIPTASVPHHAANVRQHAARRRVTSYVTRAADQLLDTTTEPIDVLTDVADHIDTALRQEIAGRADDRPRVRNIAEFLAGGDDHEYNWLIPGLLEHRDRVILTGGEGSGKALALDTPIPTPTGWTTMGEVCVGDQVIGADGKPTTVQAATDIMTGRPCYRVTFSDGTSIIADADHQWLTETYESRIRTAQEARRGPTKTRGTDQRHKRKHYPAVVTTAQIAATIRARGGHTLNHSINAAAPLDLPDADLPIDPYILGAWLGDGDSATSRFTVHTGDWPNLRDQITAAGYHHSQPIPHKNSPETLRVAVSTQPVRRGGHHAGTDTLNGRLRSIGVLGNKHIPGMYLRASYWQRLALLQGLMDTDGTISNTGAQTGRGYGVAKIEFSVVNERLAKDVYELVTSLGIIATNRESNAVLNGRVVSRRYRLQFQTEMPVFRLPRKADRITPLRTARSRHRFITAVTPVESVPVRCIQVSNDNHLYLAGSGMVPTHNSTLGRQIAVQTAAGLHPFTLERIEPKRVLIVDFENSEDQLRRELRPLNAKAGVQLDPDNLFVETRISGVDLAGSAEDREWFNDIAAEARPDIIVTGPTYKMADGDPNEEKSAKPVAMFLDRLREQFGCAIWMEAHVGNEPPGSKKRPTRPFGWSGWRRWPEFGVYLDKSGEIEHWRGQRDSTRVWPQILQRGGSWPWGSGTSDNEVRWLRIRDCLKDANERLSNRELARRLDMSEAMVRRVTGEFAQQYEALVFQLGGDRDD